MIITAEPRKDGFMNIAQVVDVIRELSHSQGFYSRLYNNILEVHENQPEVFENFKTVMEAQNFKDPLDVVMFYET